MTNAFIYICESCADDGAELRLCGHTICENCMPCLVCAEEEEEEEEEQP